MNAKGVGSLRQVAVTLLDDFHDEAAIEFAQRILVVDAFLDHLRHELFEQPMHSCRP